MKLFIRTFIVRVSRFALLCGAEVANIANTLLDLPHIRIENGKMLSFSMKCFRSFRFL